MYIKKLMALLLAFSSIILFSKVTYANIVEDANWNMWHGVQDALILGGISKIENDIVIVDVEKCLSGKAIIDARYRQLPESDIGDSLQIKNFGVYQSSYSEKIQPEVGDYIVISIDKKGDEWVANWQPFEVSSLDYTLLEFEPSDKTTSQGMAWLNFVRSDGHVNDFTFISKEDGTEQVFAKGVFDDGKVVEEIIYETKTTNFSINVGIQKKILFIKVGVAVSGIIGIIAAILCMNKVKTK